MATPRVKTMQTIHSAYQVASIFVVNLDD